MQMAQAQVFGWESSKLRLRSRIPSGCVSYPEQHSLLNFPCPREIANNLGTLKPPEAPGLIEVVEKPLTEVNSFLLLLVASSISFFPSQ